MSVTATRGAGTLATESYMIAANFRKLSFDRLKLLGNCIVDPPPTSILPPLAYRYTPDDPNERPPYSMLRADNALIAPDAFRLRMYMFSPPSASNC